MFVVFPEFCEHTHTQYDYHTLPPTLRGETLASSQVNPVLIIDERPNRKLKRDPGLLSQAEIEGIERDGNHLLNL